MGKVSIDEQLTYEGYLWWSDKENPDVITGSISGKLPADGDNPFVVEGMLYNEKEGISYSIKYVDGEYNVKKYTNVKKDIENNDNEVKEYLSNRMEGRWLRFLRYWEEDKSDKDESDKDEWPVLTQTKNVFIGFKK